MVYNRYGLYLTQKGQNDKAKQMLKKALRIGYQESHNQTKEVQESIILTREILQAIEGKGTPQLLKKQKKNKIKK